MGQPALASDHLLQQLGHSRLLALAAQLSMERMQVRTATPEGLMQSLQSSEPTWLQREPALLAAQPAAGVGTPLDLFAIAPQHTLLKALHQALKALEAATGEALGPALVRLGGSYLVLAPWRGHEAVALVEPEALDPFLKALSG